jgi:hypothetical protein
LLAYGRRVLPAALPPPDTTPPAIVISSPRPGQTISEENLAGTTVAIKGRVTDPDDQIATFTVAGRPITPNPAGDFLADVKVRRGSNTVVAHAVDSHGNAADKSVTFTIKAASAPARRPSSNANDVRDRRGDAHGSPLDLKRVTRSKTRTSWLFRIEFWSAVPTSRLYFHGPNSGNVIVTMGGRSAQLSANCLPCIEGMGPGAIGRASRPNRRTVLYKVRRSYWPNAPWGVFAGYRGGNCRSTGHTETATTCKDMVRG